MLGNLFGAPNKETFVTSLLQAIRRAGDERAIRFDRERFCLLVDSQKGRLSLDPAYDEYVAAEGRERRGVIERYVALWLQGGENLTPDTFAEARSHLFPRLRERMAFEQVRMRGTELPFRLLAPDLGLELVYQAEDGRLIPLEFEHFEEWEVSFEEALRVARENLMQRPGSFRSPQPGFYLATGRDGLEAAGLLLVDRIARLEVRGSLVAMVPRPDVLAVTGSDDPPGLTRMVSLAAQALEMGSPLLPAPVIWRDNAWHPYMPPRQEAIRRLWLQTRARDYAQQAAPLSGLFPDAEVAPFQISREWVATSRWEGEREQLLPECEQVALIRERPFGFFRFERMIELGLLEPLELFPRRWRATGFPAPEQIAQLR